MRLAKRQGWWLSVGWSKEGRVSCVHRSKGRHLEGAWMLGRPSGRVSIVVPSRTSSAAATGKEREKV